MTAAAAKPRGLLSSPTVSASLAIHAVAAGAVLFNPPAWPWGLGAVAANHLVLTAAGLWPRSRLLGANWTRLPAASGARREVAITIDDGPDPVITPQVLTLLDRHGARATFFCVGERVERHPTLALEIVRRGHSIENHSQHHRHNFSLLGPRGMKREIAAAQQSITRITGHAPQFFRAPAGLRNPFLDPVLSRLELRLASWTRRGFDTVRHDAQAVYHRLADPLRAGDILLLHDGNAARDASGTPVILTVLPRLLEALAARNFTPVTLRAGLE